MLPTETLSTLCRTFGNPRQTFGGPPQTFGDPSQIFGGALRRFGAGITQALIGGELATELLAVAAKVPAALLALHLGYETAEPYDLSAVRSLPAHGPFKVRLKADPAAGCIVLDDTVSLHGIPEAAWRYRLGNRSALEWVLDQYKERRPKDPTLAAHFDTYRFADHAAHVTDLLARVCTVSVQTMAVVDALAERSPLRPGA